MKKLIVLILFYGLLIEKPVLALPKLILNGQASDYFSGVNLSGVAFYMHDGRTRSFLCKGDSLGVFSFVFPAEGKELIVEKSGYRSISTAVASYRNELSTGSFYIRIPLIPLDKQAANVPYMQSEQKEFTLDKIPKAGRAVSRTFLILDAISGKSITNGTLCFQYTKDKKRDCVQLDTGGGTRTHFTQADIIGFMVQANGYQPYSGNLILDKIDGSSTRYEIKLTPDLTMLSLNISQPVQGAVCTLTSSAGLQITLTSRGSTSFYSLLTEGNYDFKIASERADLARAGKVAVGRGLNFLGLNLKQAGAFDDGILNQQKLQITVQDSLKDFTVFFNQGDYTLNPVEKGKLDALARSLVDKAKQKIRIVGHSDNVGDPKINLALSEKRARVIRFYLLGKNVREQQILFVGVGGKYPLRKNDSEENRKMNRRVEISMLPN